MVSEILMQAWLRSHTFVGILPQPPSRRCAIVDFVEVGHAYGRFDRVVIQVFVAKTRVADTLKLEAESPSCS